MTYDRVVFPELYKVFDFRMLYYISDWCHFNLILNYSYLMDLLDGYKFFIRYIKLLLTSQFLMFPLIISKDCLTITFKTYTLNTLCRLRIKSFFKY